MAGLKLAKLPDRTPVKLTITISPDLQRDLADYAAVYNAVYGQDEPVAELVPHMIAGFLAADREFARRRKAQSGE